MVRFDRVLKAASTTAFGLSALAVAVFVLVSAVVGVFLTWKTNTLLTNQVLATLNAEARMLTAELETGGRAKLIDSVTDLSRPDGTGLYFYADAHGTKIAGNLNRVPPELQEDPHGGVFTYQPSIEKGEMGRLGVAIPVKIGNDQILYVGRDIDDQRAIADSMRVTFLVGFGLLSLAGLLGGLAVSRFVLSRMEVITETSQSIMDGDMSRRIPVVGGGGELDALAKNLNGMLDRIEGLMSGLREVSDNIAHDLKTPLNRIRNSAEAALRDPRGGEAYREGLERTIEKADDLIKTFNALLLIARLEAGPLRENLEDFDVGAFVEDVADLYAPAAEEAGFSLSIATEPGILVHANRQLIGQAVANLIDNGIKYSRADTREGAITVGVRLTASGPEISVGDRGPGISPGDRERVLKRFVRLEESRTLPGTGLGLSLVAAVARLHSGEVRLQDNDPGLKVTLVLSPKCLVVREHFADAPAGLVAAK